MEGRTDEQLTGNRNQRWLAKVEFSDASHTGPDGSRLVPFPFTTTALNTAIDILGRLGDIPKRIQAFEVLTQPLPHANETFSVPSSRTKATITANIPLPHAKRPTISCCVTSVALTMRYSHVII
jgi:hypothetical protein